MMLRPKYIRPVLLFALLFLVTQPVLAAERPDRILKKGGWELQIFYRFAGTRSEGQYGKLLHDGKLVAGKEGQELQTDLGTLKYYGEKAVHLWLPTGWNFKDPDTIPGSSDTNRLESETGKSG